MLNLLIGIQSFSQNTEPIKITLSQALKIGLENRNDVKSNKINIDVANNTIEKKRKEWLPNIEMVSSVKYNTQLEQMIFPSGYDNNEQSSVAIGTKNQTMFALEMTQPIFKPGLNTDIKISKNESLLESEKNNEKAIVIKQKIAEAYLNVLLKNLQYKFTHQTTDRYAEYYKIAEKKYTLGTLIETDLSKSNLDYENAKVLDIESQHNYEIALMNLKYQLNINDSQQIILADSIESIQEDYLVDHSNFVNRTELKQLELQIESNRLKLNKSKLYFLPTLSFIANYSNQYQGENFSYNEENSWSQFNYIGIKMVLPITGNLKNINSIKENKLIIEQDKFQLLQKQTDIDYEIKKAQSELVNTQNIIKTTKDNLDLSTKIYTNQLKTYQLGTIGYSAILDNEITLNTAQQNYVKAVYNYLVSRIDYAKSKGNL